MIDSSERAESLSPLKRAILELREMRAQLDADKRARTEPIAIIGMGLRFPGGANSPDSFWQLLREGVDAIGPIPSDRWDAEAYYDPDPTTPGKMYTRHGAFLDQVDQFDPQFFGISPREAAMMDPQQRLLLETAWEALERAGHAPDRLHGTQTGVFIGIANSDYFRMLANDPEEIDVYFATGNTFSVAAGRISYLLGLHGPSIAVDTACSSSLTTVHLAVQSLRARECDLALAGGVNVILAPEVNINFSRAQMMAPDGRCKTFDATADGYVRGEGCAVIALKRLSDALAAGDEILAVVRGSAVNQDGRSSGLTAPNGPAQEAVISAALANSGVAPHQVSYVEAHGTGTSLGDPIEVQALGAALAVNRSPDQPLLIGSVKTNIGHLEAAAGVAGLIKVVLSLRNNTIPPHLHFTTPNPHIAWETLPIRVPTELTAWPAGATPRIAGVSSFGFSGTNAHVVIEEAPASEAVGAPDTRPLHALTLSAKTDVALRSLARSYADRLDRQPDLTLFDVCHTANTGRASLEQRLAIIATDSNQLQERLYAAADNIAAAGITRGNVPATGGPEIAFLFSGHGSAYPGMAQQLYTYHPVFRAALDRCTELLHGQIDRSLLEVLGFVSGASDLLNHMQYAQPALFAVQYALGELWRSWGIVPALVAGHSAGEYAAACFAGVFSLEDALRLVVARGRLMQSLPPGGAMVAVFADEARVRAAVAPFAASVSIAAINGPTSIVISGHNADVQVIVAALSADDIETRSLGISVAAHSPLLDPILDAFTDVAAAVQYHPPRIGLVSTLTGTIVSAEEVTTPTYWRRHLREPVRFVDALHTLVDQNCEAFVEIGPHPTLLRMAQRCSPEDYGIWLPSLSQAHDDWQQVLESLASLFVHGVAVDWNGFDAPFACRTVELPTYPFERTRCWAAPTPHQRPTADTPARWQVTVAAARRQEAQGPLDLNLASYSAKWESLNGLATAAIARALHNLGLFTRAGEQHTVDALIEIKAIVPTYRRLVRRWLGHLADDGLLTNDGDTFLAPRPLPADISTALDQAVVTLADVKPLLQYALRCSDRLAEIVTGAESPLDTLFPGGSYETVDYIYHQWAVARYFNGIVRAAAEAAAVAQSGRPIRMLEIGAGTGGTAAALLPVLPPDRAVYEFTDVSDFFLERARERFATHTFVRYGLLDIEQPPVDQGYAPHSFDVIVAANVLHATRDLDRTLQHARSLLASGGVLVAYETTVHPRWFDITTGLIEGWQLFEDTWRDDNPLLAPERWLEALRVNGFEEAVASPLADAATTMLGQSILLARAPVVDEPNVISSLPSYGEQGHTTGTVEHTSAPENTATFVQELFEALPAERHELLVEYVRGHTSRVLRLDSTRPPDRNARLMDLGVDSLVAVELRNRLAAGLLLPHKLPATLIFDYPSIDAIARLLQRQLLPEAHAVSITRPHSNPNTSPITETTALAELSDEEVEALLLKKLESL